MRLWRCVPLNSCGSVPLPRIYDTVIFELFPPTKDDSGLHDTFPEVLINMADLCGGTQMLRIRRFAMYGTFEPVDMLESG